MKLPFIRLREFSYLPLWDWAAVIISIVLFTLATLPNLTQASAYFDEGYSAFLAKQDVLAMAAYTAQDVHPPLYYALLHVWQGIVGDGLSELRLLSVIFGWVAILFGFLIVRRYFNHQAAWLAALLLSLSPLFIRYGSTMRMYTLALAIALAGTYVLLRAVTSKSKRPWIIYAVLVAAGMWTNYFMALVWVSHLAWLLYEFRRSHPVVRRWTYALAGAIMLYLPWLPWLIYRYGEIQLDGFWIEPLSIDTLASTVTQGLVFRSAANTQSWLAVGVILLIVSLVIAAIGSHQRLNKQRGRAFRMLLSMSLLPIALLAIGSLPPFRSSYVYRYVIVATVSSMLLMAVIVTYAKFKKHDLLLRVLLTAGTVVIVGTGAVQAVNQGNRNLDTDMQNKLGQTMQGIFSSGRPAPIVIRSPYSYYAASLYKSPGYDTHFLFSEDLAKVGSTKPLYDHPQAGVRDLANYQRLWMVGEDRWSARPPSDGKWILKDWVIENDDINRKVVGAAAYYERVDQ